LLIATFFIFYFVGAFISIDFGHLITLSSFISSVKSLQTSILSVVIDTPLLYVAVCTIPHLQPLKDTRPTVFSDRYGCVMIIEHILFAE